MFFPLELLKMAQDDQKIVDCTHVTNALSVSLITFQPFS